MFTTLLAILLAGSPSPALQGASVQVTINNPGSSLVANPIAIRVNVTSTLAVSQVVATIEGVDYPLMADPQSCATCWKTSVAVTLSHGTHTIAVTATDVSANQGSAEKSFTFDQPPVLIVTAPADSSVARPALRITFSCIDDDAGCQVRAQATGTQGTIVLASGTGSVDSVISLSQFDNQSTGLLFVATDSAGQETVATRTVYVDSSTHYLAVARANGQIVAFDDTRLLVTRVDQTSYTLAIQNRQSGTETVILSGTPNLAGSTVAFLTPFGAMFEYGSDSLSARVYEWRNGTLVDRGLELHGTLRVKGSYAVWTVRNADFFSKSVMFEDVAAGSVLTVASNADSADVAATGDVAYVSDISPKRVMHYLNGVSTPVPHNGDPADVDVSPVTDGTSIVYTRVGQTGQETVSYSGGQEAVLGVTGNLPEVGYMASGGWIAFWGRVSPSVSQVFAGPAGGSMSQLSFFSTGAFPAALDDSGSGMVAFTAADPGSNGQTFLASATMPAISIGGGEGITAFLHGVCYRIVGNTLFQASTSTVPSAALTAAPSSLAFAILRAAGGAVASVTPPRTVTLTQNGADLLDWGLSTDVAWLHVASITGSGSGSFSITIDPSAPGVPAAGPVSGHITILVSTPTTPIVIPVQLTVYANGATAPPFGSFDTPVNGATGLQGSIAVTGWALDTVQVARLTVCRDPAAGETAPVDPNCAGAAKIYIGDATFVEGARPDVQGMFPAAPLNSRAGWGYLMLTNFLPSGGNGTFVLYAYATNVAGQTVLLGTKTIGVDNAHSVAPFGAIDTPGQGAVVNGFVANFGWVLSPGSRRSDPPGGGSVTVFVDGSPVGSPAGWTHRDDLSALFPVSQYAGVETALAVYGLDTTTLANGVHTISWAVTDNLNVTSGIGSRFFTVSNGAVIGGQGSGIAKLRVSSWQLEAENSQLQAGTIVVGRVGFDLNAPLRYFFPDRDGVVTINARVLDRIELQLEPGVTGVMLTPKGERSLPIGTHIDSATGLFTWAPGPGFVGRYEFVLGGRHVRVVLHP